MSTGTLSDAFHTYGVEWDKDHVSFMVDSRDDLESAASALSEAGIEHGEVIDLADAGLAILSFQDPDDINVELTAPLG